MNDVPAVDAEGLFAIQRAHRLAIPFENIDIPLGRGVSLKPEDIFDKLIRRGRGGYCFEQNSLFLAALHALGFEARPLLARVWLRASEIPSKTHMVNLVTIADEPWLADAGFGGSYTPPMRLGEGEVEAPDGIHYRLTHDTDFGWMLMRRADGESWTPQYSFTTAQVWPADFEQANHFVSTVPGGRFTGNVVASIVLPHGFASLFNRDYSRTSAKGEERAQIASAKALQLRLSLMFGINLTSEEIETLRLF